MLKSFGINKLGINKLGIVSPPSFSFLSYWTHMISAVVEDASPTHVVMTWASGKSLLATDLSCMVNGVARTISSASWAGGVWTVVLASAVVYSDVVVMTFEKTGQTKTVTNNVLYYFTAEKTGTGVGVSVLRMSVSSDISINIVGDGRFYTDAAGTIGESTTWNITAGAFRTMYFKVTSGTSTFKFSDASKFIYWGDKSNQGFAVSINAPKITCNLSLLPLQKLHLAGQVAIAGSLPSVLRELLLDNLFGVTITLTSLPSWLTYILLQGNGITFTSSASLPTGLTYLYLSGNAINWTGLDIGNNGNIATFNLSNYRVAKMSSADMVTLLTQMTNRTGTLPATVTINDYADYASPPAEVVAAVATLKTAKSITTVTLGA